MTFVFLTTIYFALFIGFISGDSIQDEANALCDIWTSLHPQSWSDEVCSMYGCTSITLFGVGCTGENVKSL